VKQTIRHNNIKACSMEMHSPEEGQTNQRNTFCKILGCLLIRKYKFETIRDDDRHTESKLQMRS